MQKEARKAYYSARDDGATVAGGLSGAGAGALLGMLGGPVGMFLGATIGASAGGGIGLAAGAPERRSRVLTHRVQKTRAREVRREETRYLTSSVTETVKVPYRLKVEDFFTQAFQQILDEDCRQFAS